MVRRRYRDNDRSLAHIDIYVVLLYPSADNNGEHLKASLKELVLFHSHNAALYVQYIQIQPFSDDKFLPYVSDDRGTLGGSSYRHSGQRSETLQVGKVEEGGFGRG